MIDILVVGDGIAGCAAAIVAKEEGMDVSVIEKAPRDVPHGNTAFSGGSFRRVSDGYSAETFYRDMMSLSNNKADPELTRIMVEGSREARDWLANLGVRWTDQSRNPIAADHVDGDGVVLAAVLRKAADRKGIKINYETEALRLLKDGDRVLGAMVRNKQETSEIRSLAVILATGGFQANPEMVTRYIGPGGVNLVLRGSPYNTGDGMRMAEEVGAKLDWMDDFHGGLIHFGYKQYPDVGVAAGMRSMKRYEHGILVNQEGKRFVDEGEHPSEKTYAKFGKIVALTQPGGVAYVIFDTKSSNIIDPDYTGPEKEPVEAGTIKELAAKLGINADALQATVDEFNAGVNNNKCMTVKPPKTQFAQVIDKPPFYAYKVTGGFTFTFGGLRANPSAEVLDNQLQPIPGLYAAGEITTGIFYGNYAGGSSLPRCAVFGRIAGKNAANFARTVRST